MLIGIRFPATLTKDEKVDKLKQLVSNIMGKVRIYEPSSMENYIAAVKGYDPRVEGQHLVLLSTHFNYADTLRPHDWRMHDYYFDFKGGTQWGVPVDRASLTYQEDTDDCSKIVSIATWAQSRAAIVRRVSGKYLGSTTFEPHTLLIGYGIEYPASSYPFKCLLGSLPNSSSSQTGNKEWWTGVGLLRLKDYTEKVREHFEFSHIVTLGDASHEELTKLGLEHGSAPKVPYAAYHGKIRRYSPGYGTVIREVGRTNEDMRHWTE